MGKISISCVTSLEDIQFETLRDEQAVNIAGMSVPIGVESEGMTVCKVSSVEEEDGKIIEEDLGRIGFKAELDEGDLYTTFEMTDDLPKNVQDELDIELFDLL